MTMTELDHVLTVTSRVTGVQDYQIRRDTNKEENVRARMVFANVLWRIYPSISLNRTGRFVGRHHSSISHYRSSHEGRMMTDKLYKGYFFRTMKECKPDYFEEYPDKSRDELSELLKWHEREAELIRKVLEV